MLFIYLFIIIVCWLFITFLYLHVFWFGNLNRYAAELDSANRKLQALMESLKNATNAWQITGEKPQARDSLCQTGLFCLYFSDHEPLWHAATAGETGLGCGTVPVFWLKWSMLAELCESVAHAPPGKDSKAVEVAPAAKLWHGMMTMSWHGPLAVGILGCHQMQSAIPGARGVLWPGTGCKVKTTSDGLSCYGLAV